MAAALWYRKDSLRVWDKPFHLGTPADCEGVNLLDCNAQCLAQCRPWKGPCAVIRRQIKNHVKPRRQGKVEGLS